MKNYYEFRSQLSDELEKEAKKLSDELYYNILACGYSYYNEEEIVKTYRRKLKDSITNKKEDFLKLPSINFIYQKLNDENKELFDILLELAPTRVFFNSSGNIRSYKSDTFKNIQSFYDFAKGLLLLQKINFNLIDFFEGKKYFEDLYYVELVDSTYYACLLSLNNSSKITEIIKHMIYDNENLLNLSHNLIKGMLLSTNSEAWDMAMDLLKSAKLSEGLRQAIVENIDLAQIDVFKRFLKYIHEENLIRFSSVRRAFLCFTGLEYDIQEKNQKYLESKIYDCLVEEKILSYLNSKSTLDIYIGLYALATENSEMAYSYIDKNYESWEDYKKAVGIKVLSNCGLYIPAKLIISLIKSSKNSKLIVSILKISRTYVYFEKVEEKIEVLNIIVNFLDNAGKKLKGYNILEETDEDNINLSDTATLLMNISDDLDDFYELGYKYYNLVDYLHGFEKVENSFIRETLIKILSSNKENHRSFAQKKILDNFLPTRKIVNTQIPFLTKDEYKIIGTYFKSKRSDLRKAISSIISTGEPNLILEIGKDLLKEKNIECQRGALDILVENIDKIKPLKEYSEVLSILNEISISAEMIESVNILLGKNVQIKSVKESFYDVDYKPTLEPIYYDKEVIKKHLNPDEDKIIEFTEKSINLLKTFHQKEYAEIDYSGSKEMKIFDFNNPNIYFNGFEEFIFQEKFTEIYDNFAIEELLIMKITYKCLHNYYYNKKDIYSKEDGLKDEVLIEKKYYPSLAKVKKYFEKIEHENKYKLISVIDSLINYLYNQEIEKGILDKNTENDYNIEIINYFIELDKKYESPNQDFKESLKYINLYENESINLSRRLLNMALHIEEIRIPNEEEIENKCWNETPYHITNNIPIDLLIKSVEMGILNIDYIYQLMMDVKKTDSNYSWSNSRQIINYFNTCTRNKKETEIISKVYNECIIAMLEVELERTEKDTIFSESIYYADVLPGVEVFLRALYKMGNMPFVRGYYWGDAGKKNMFSNIVYKAYPLETDTYEKFESLIKKYKISDKKLIEATMYNLKFVDYTERYLGIKGLKKCAYYFKAHMNETFSENEEKIIRRYTDLDFKDLQLGQMALNWFRESYEELGEQEFLKLYDSAKYITSGGNHKRAQYFADAVLGKLDEKEVLERIDDKRNQEMVLAYGLIPLGKDKKSSAIRRYKRLQGFIKESKAFGAQRKASELAKATIALNNLARNYGFSDYNRFTWMIETEMLQEMKEYFEPVIIDNVSVKLSLENISKPEIIIESNGKKLKSVPAKLKKHEYILKLTQAKKDLIEQNRRAKKSLEDSMINEDLFEFSEIKNLNNHPIIKEIINKLLFIHNNQIGLLTPNGLKTLSDEIILKDTDKIKIVHPANLFELGVWPKWQDFILTEKIIQPFKQVFRELYTMTKEEEKQDGFTSRFAGYQVEGSKMLGLLKSRDWILNDYQGFEKVNHKHNLRIDLYSYADWFTPSEIESPSIEKLVFMDNKTEKTFDMKKLSKVIFSETMRDMDLVVSVAYVGGIDVMMNHSTIEMRKRIINHNLELFKTENYEFSDNHILIKGSYGNYNIHLGSGVTHMEGKGMLPIFPVHSQQRGHIFLPFVDEDPKTAEILSKILMLSKDNLIKDPSILMHLK